MQIHASPDRQGVPVRLWEVPPKETVLSISWKNILTDCGKCCLHMRAISCLRLKSTTREGKKCLEKSMKRVLLFFWWRLIDVCQITASDFKQVRQTLWHSTTFLMKRTDFVGIELVRNREQCRMTTLFGTALVCAYILPHCYYRIIDKMWCVWHVQGPMSWGDAQRSQLYII